jgi:hypothetical protein
MTTRKRFPAMTRADLNRNLLARYRETHPAPAVTMLTATELRRRVTPLFHYVETVGNKFRIYVSETGCYEGTVCTTLTLPNGNWFETFHEAETALIVAMEVEA